jgi:hypothetical protein
MRISSVVTAVLVALLIGGLASVPASASAGSAKTCWICGNPPASLMQTNELGAGEGDAGKECVKLTGNGFGYDGCLEGHVGEETACQPLGDLGCQTGASLAFNTGIDGSLTGAIELSSTQQHALAIAGRLTRPCDEAIVARLLTSPQADNVIATTSTITL